jgi:hypothetical protein
MKSYESLATFLFNGFLSSSILLLILLAPVNARAQAPNSDLRPKFDWKVVKESVVALDPMQLMLPEGAADRRDDRMKFSIEADSGVFFGVLPSATLRQVLQQNVILRANHFQQMKCGRAGIVKAEIECVLQPGETYIIRDKRAEGSAAMSALGAMSGQTQVVERATKPNKVKLTISEWICVENCLSAT